MRQRLCLFLASFLTVSALAVTGNEGGRTRRQVAGYTNPGYGQERDINVVCDCDDYNRRRQYNQQGYYGNTNTNYPQNNGYGQYNNGYGQYNSGYGQYNTGYGQQPFGGILSMLSRMPLFG